MNLLEYDLEGRKAVLVGASRGIGKGVALVLAQVGVEVAIASLNIDSAQAAVDEINSAGGKATAFAADATRLQDMERLVARAAMGAAGGAGGLPTALAELPVTTTLLLRVIQGVAVEHGFDAHAENVQFDCVQVFSAAGPLSEDDGADLAFLSARVALSGRAMQAVIAKVAPRLALVLGQKLAAQAVPVLGAVAGAATNYAYTSYYEDMAHVHFGLRKLAIDADVPHEELVERLRAKVGLRKIA